MPRLGSEEFYNNMAGIGGGPIPYGEYGQENRDTVAQMAAASRRQQDIQQRVGQDMANTKREVGYNYGKAIGQLPQVYANAKQGAQNYRQGEQNIQKGGYETEEARQRMETGQKEQGLLDKPVGPGGMSRREQNMVNRQAAEEQGLKTGAASLQAMATQNKLQNLQIDQATTSKKRDDAAAVLKNAMRSGDPTAMESARAQASQIVGGNAIDLQVAETAARENITAAEASSNMVYDTSVPGQLANNQVVDVDSDIKALAQLQNSIKDYRTATAGSKEAQIAQQNAKQAMEQLKMNPEDIEDIDGGLGGVSLDTSGIKTRTDKMNQALSRAKNNTSVKLNTLKARAGGSASPRIRAQIQNLEQTLAQLNSISASKTNIFNGRPGPSGPTALTNALSGQQPQMGPGQYGGGQQQPMPQPAMSFSPDAQQKMNQIAPPGGPQQGVSPFRQNQVRQ